MDGAGVIAWFETAFLVAVVIAFALGVGWVIQRVDEQPPRRDDDGDGDGDNTTGAIIGAIGGGAVSSDGGAGGCDAGSGSC